MDFVRKWAKPVIDLVKVSLFVLPRSTVRSHVDSTLKSSGVSSFI